MKKLKVEVIHYPYDEQFVKVTEKESFSMEKILGIIFILIMTAVISYTFATYFFTVFVDGGLSVDTIRNAMPR